MDLGDLNNSNNSKNSANENPPVNQNEPIAPTSAPDAAAPAPSVESNPVKPEETPAPPQEPEKPKSHNLLWIILFILVVAIVGFFIWNYLNNSHILSNLSQPTATSSIIATQSSTISPASTGTATSSTAAFTKTTTEAQDMETMKDALKAISDGDFTTFSKYLSKPITQAQFDKFRQDVFLKYNNVFIKLGTCYDKDGKKSGSCGKIGINNKYYEYMIDMLLGTDASKNEGHDSLMVIWLNENGKIKAIRSNTSDYSGTLIAEN